MKHNKMPFGWKWSAEFSWDMSMADKLFKLDWSIKTHEEAKKND